MELLKIKAHNIIKHIHFKSEVNRIKCEMFFNKYTRSRKVLMSSLIFNVCTYVKVVSCVQVFATPWTVAHQATLSMGFSRQEYWSGLPFPSPGDLPKPGIEPMSPTLQANSLPSEPPGIACTVLSTLVYVVVEISQGNSYKIL